MKRAQIEQLLPEVYQRTIHEQSALWALLQVMEDLHAKAEAGLRNLDAIFDPRRTDDSFVPYLASWCDLGRLFPERHKFVDSRRRSRMDAVSTAALRELTASAAWLGHWSGTRTALLGYLVTATGDSRFRVVENMQGDGAPRAFHLVVFAPEDLLRERDLLESIITSAKPVSATHELVFESPIAAPTPSDATPSPA